jgi:hypothetical protein
LIYALGASQDHSGVANETADFLKDGTNIYCPKDDQVKIGCHCWKANLLLILQGVWG